MNPDYLAALRPYRVKTYPGNVYVVGATSLYHAESLILMWYREVAVKVQRIPTAPLHKGGNPTLGNKAPPVPSIIPPSLNYANRKF